MRICRADRLMPFLCILINHVRTYPYKSFKITCSDYYFVFLILMSKRSADNGNLPQGKRRLTGFNPEWDSNFPFVLYTEDASGAGFMFCSAVVLLRRNSEETLYNLFKNPQSTKNCFDWYT